MPTNQPKHILFAPLDWGLGHTARCMPLIGYMISQGHIVTVAGNQSQRSFIEETFSGIDFIHLEGYNITYTKWNKFAQAGLLCQMPGILKTIKKEHDWLQKLAEERKIDGIISDNRYGLYHNSIPSVIMTHQIMVQSGLGMIPDRVIQKMHFKLLERFNKTWIVDVPGTLSLGDKLSHSANLPRNGEYIGLLSRFSEINRTRDKAIFNNKNADIVVLLSGPEPQRTEISRILWQQASKYPGKVAFTEGSENAMVPKQIPTHINYHKRIGQNQLYQLLENAGMIICRSGYSSVMDLVALQKKAILIPTPGQTEQIYLAKHLHEKSIFYSSVQQGFDLVRSLKSSETFPFKRTFSDGAFSLYKEVIRKWCDSL